MPQKLLFEIGSNGLHGTSLPNCDVPEKDITAFIPEKYQRKTPARLPQVSEPEVVRHFVNLSTMNHHVDKDFYPLGSCTMKYNPKVNEDMSSLPGFTAIHPLQAPHTVQGALGLLDEIGQYLCEISGLPAITLQPSAGAHGELTALMMIRAYHDKKGKRRKYVLIPDSAHGTNPASVSIAGYESITIKSNADGLVDINVLKEHLNDDVAAFMLTNPNTLGIFETQVKEIAELLHSIGALLYMDGANMNALLGHIRPGDLGFDVIHYNLHKTFSTPHGGGGPGSGPIAVSDRLVDFLPVPCVQCVEGEYILNDCRADTIGKIASFYGNFGVIVRAFTYIRILGKNGLKNVSKNAIINANYLLSRIKEYYDLAFQKTPMHEFILSGERQKKQGAKTLDIAKRLLDFGVHAPTVYFPLNVSEAIMIEPTETESKATLDRFADILIQIAEEIKQDPEILKQAPMSTPVSRLDEAGAARSLNVRYVFPQD